MELSPFEVPMPSFPPETLDFAWGFHERVAAAFTAPLEEMRASLQRATEPPVLVSAAEPSNFQRAAMLGLAAVTDIALDGSLPAPVRTALRDLPQHYQELLS